MTKSNEPAYPASVGQKLAGLTMREHFAGQALAGICANPYVADYMMRNKLSTEVTQQKYADTAVALADLVIARLEKA